MGKRILYTLYLFLFCISCSNSIEGTLTDEKGHFLQNKKMVAVSLDKKADPQKHIATTNSKGRFTIKGLIPNNEYRLEPLFGEWKGDHLWRLKYGADNVTNFFDRWSWWAKDPILDVPKIKTGGKNEKVELSTAIIIAPYKTGFKGSIVDAKKRPLSKIKLTLKPANKFLITKENPFKILNNKNLSPSYKNLKKFYPNLKKNNFRTRSGLEIKVRTDENGNFACKDLIPNTKYSILYRNHLISGKFISPKRNSTRKIGSLTLRYLFMGNGLKPTFGSSSIYIYDTLTGLEWENTRNVKSANMRTNPDNGWKIPSLGQLKTLYDPSIRGPRKIHPLFRMNDITETGCVWSQGYGFTFNDGKSFRRVRAGQCYEFLVRKYQKRN